MKRVSQWFAPVRSPSTARNPYDASVAFDRRLLAIGLWVFAGYYIGAKIGFALTFKPHPVSVLWPPNSILVAALLLTPPRIWWFVLLVAFPAHCAAQLQSHVPLPMIFGWFISNCSEALIGAGLTRYLARGPIQLTSLRNAGIFCLCVVFAGPFFSSFLDAAFVRWNAWGEGSYWDLIRMRFFSNALAALIVAPLILTWATSGIAVIRRSKRARLLEASLLLAGLLWTCFIVFYKLGPPADSVFLFATLPFLLWAAARFGSLGMSTALSLVGFMAIWSAAYGHGPFSGGTAEENALSIQIFLIVLSIPMLFLAAVIEERASGETELRESESRFRIVADAAPVLIWMSGTDKLCNFFNKPWLEFTGRSLEQEMGDGWAQGVHPDDLQRCLKTYTEAFDARQSFVMQYRLRRFDNEYRWISDQGVPRYDSKGNFAGYIGSCADVTDLIKKDEALREFEERVVLAAEATHHGVWEMDTTTREIWMSDKARSLFQFNPESPVDESMYQSRVHPEDRALREAAIKQAIKTQGEYALEYRVLLPDGTLRWISGRGRCLPGKHGKGTRLLGVSVDVSPQKEAQDVFRLAADGLHLGVWHWDETAQTLVWDKASRELFGVSADAEITIDTFYRALHPDDAERVKQNWRRALELRLPYQIEFRTQRKDASIRWVDARGQGYYDDIGKPLSMTGVVFDITDLKEAELAAQRNREELGHLSRVAAMGQLAASIAHELNQPLAGITSNASAGQRFIDRGEIDLAELRELLGDIVADGRRAGDVIRSLQTMVKKGVTARQRVNLNNVVMNVVRMVKPDAILRSCELGTFLDPGLPVVEGDPIQLQQVLLNLIVNAFDAMTDTPITRRKVVIVTERNDHSAICVSVRDYGIGIPQEVIERMFDQFFTTKVKGLGMGLSIVHSIVESHGGMIAAENAHDGGARLRFTLPIPVGS
ncbi:MAG TPA: PAS domain-containing protein [Candidatus Udaeobacter sp.]|nr:PAS domain-containing protein [Candidatus Udaeobacter sp.]